MVTLIPLESMSEKVKCRYVPEAEASALDVEVLELSLVAFVQKARTLGALCYKLRAL